MKGQSSRVSFNVSSAREGKPKIRNYTYKDMVKRIDMYVKARSRSSKSLDKDLYDIKDQAFQNRAERDKKRGVQMEYARQGIKNLTNTPEQKLNLEAMHKEQDRKDIREKMRRAKKLYSHYGLSQNYNDKSRDRDMSRDKFKDKDKNNR